MSDAADLGFASLRIVTPLLFAAMGGVLSERAGVVNLALESYLLAGAFGTAAGTLATGSVAAGVVCGVGAAVLVALVHGLVCTRSRADHVVSGVAMNLLVDAATIATLVSIYHTKGSTPAFAADAQADVLSMKLLGLSPLTWLAVALVPGIWWFLRATKPGLRLRAVGENPECAESLGVDAARVRLAAVLAAGAVTGLGGVYLALDVACFTKHMASGRGYLALAAVVIGKWRAGWVGAAALLFAALTATADFLQPRLDVPEQLPQMLPYVATLIVLSGIVGRAKAPAALGRPLG
jgi:simple sugar transport system permease protein